MSKGVELPAKLRKDYEVVNTHLPILESRIGRIDFRRLTKEQAEKLIKLDTRYLVRIEKPLKGAKQDKE